MSGRQNDWSGKMSWLQNVWVSKYLDFYAVAQYPGGTMSVSKKWGVKMSGAEMSENPKGQLTLQYPSHKR